MALAAHVALGSYLAVSGSVFVTKAAEAKAFFLDFFCACVRCQARVGWAFRRWVGSSAEVAGWSFCWVGAAIFCGICIHGCDSGGCGRFPHLVESLNSPLQLVDEVGECELGLVFPEAFVFLLMEGFLHVLQAGLEETRDPFAFPRLGNVGSFVSGDVDPVDFA